MSGIHDPSEIRSVLDGLEKCKCQIIDHPERSIFARAILLIDELRAAVHADDCLLDEKDDALAAVNEGNGVADADLWAQMKNDRDAARSACKAIVDASLSGSAMWDTEKLAAALQSAKRALRMPTA